MMYILPDTLHELLELALNDREIIIQDDDYHLSSMAWHVSDRDDDNTFVCLAGCVMANSKKTLKGQSKWPFEFSPDDHRKLYAISNLSFGLVAEAVEEMSLVSFFKMPTEEQRVPDRCVTYPDKWGSEQWLENMKQLLSELKEKGI